MRPSPGHALATTVKILALAVLYLATARLGLALASLSDSASPVWPASGLAVAGLLIFGRETWPFVFLGAFVANALTPEVGLPAAASIALGNTGEALLGAMLFARIDGIDKERLQVSRAAAHGLAAIVAPVCSATVGISTLLVAGNLTWDVNLGAIWVTWWTGDALGILIVNALLVALREVKPADYHPARLWASLFSGLLPVLGLSAAALILAFLPAAHSLLGPASALGIFLLYPAILLTARRYGPAAAQLVVVLTAAVFVVATAAGVGPFIDAGLNQSLLNMQAMLATFALTAIVFSDIPRQSAHLGSMVFLVGCLVATGVFLDRTDIARSRDEAHLNKIVDTAMGRIHERLLVYSNALEAGAALYATGLPVGRREWQAFAETINVDGRYPGINGIGVIYPVAADGLEAFLRKVRADGAPNFTLRAASHEPILDDFADALEYDVITYIEPADINAAAQGLNIATEANRREAARRARDTGQPAMTKRITLVQDTQRRAGFLYFIPVYVPGLPLDTVAQRRQALRCWIYAPFISEVFFREALRGMVDEVDVAVYDGGEVKPDALLYRKTSAASLGSRLATRLGLKPDRHDQTSRIDEGGHALTLAWTRSPTFASAGQAGAALAAASLSFIALMLAALTANLHLVSARATAIAEGMTRELSAINAKLLATSNRLTLATRAGGIGVWELDLLTNELVWDARMFQLYDVDPNIPGPLPLAVWQSRCHPDDLGRMQAEVQAAIRGETPLDTEFRIRLPGGAVRHVKTNALVERDGSGQALKIVGVNWDVTAARESAQALTAEKRRAEEANRAKNDFLANMSHEVRTPMNGVVGMVQLLLDTPNLSAEQRGYAETIRDSADALLGVINDILDISKLEAGKIDLENLSFDLGELVEGVAAILAPRARDKGIELGVLVVEEARRHWHGDPTRLRQVLLNLAGNAVKFTDRGWVSIIVTCMAGNTPGTHRLRFTVQDTGIGLSEDQVRRLFVKFTQADASVTRRFGGTGLGLAICKQLVELMDGDIGVESAPGQGSVFWFELPLAPAEPATAPLPSLESVRGRHALVVDDLAMNRLILTHNLGFDLGLRVDEASDGETALERLWSAADGPDPYDILLIDNRMPGLSGPEVVTRIRADARFQNLRIILVSSVEPEDGSEGIRYDALLPKPVRRLSLNEAVARAFGCLMPPCAAKTAEPDAVPDGQGRRVLVVEDNPTNQAVAALMLRKAGYTVAVVEDGAQAVAACAHDRYDIILMDVQMPVMDGVEATRRIRAAETADGRGRTPILAMTANAMAGMSADYTAAGMDDCVYKPFRQQQMLQAVYRWSAGQGTAPSLPVEATAAMTIDPTLPLLEDTVLARLKPLAGPPAFQSLIRDFIDGGSSRVDIVSRLATQTGDLDLGALGRQAHDLISTAGNCGLRQLENAARQLQAACEAGDTHRARSLGRLISTIGAQSWEALGQRFLEPAD
ncbi:CHASE domain-containing protein [Nitrospirillum iridis]|uniref:Sensory/regulatory protein RpfC n=1 Tax=Nitrospirillum iridis TaxID=765888 RepID=A0A7X0ECJ2_9PROT|nr:CHASE domain-containing protein [Nitrospirillum iridis]MBB6251175.1 signal transduction histidine kinase/CheY-like chemotaxis protein/integral membrane sensor domain MASE1/HPt (histidine-containing phosphotransfer) domain-containing protein [Nitrospirillum iridis]